MLSKSDLLDGVEYRLFPIQEKTIFELQGKWIAENQHFDFYDAETKVKGVARFEDLVHVALL